MASGSKIALTPQNMLRALLLVGVGAYVIQFAKNATGLSTPRIIPPV